jgi:hypothetical protein
MQMFMSADLHEPSADMNTVSKRQREDSDLSDVMS